METKLKQEPVADGTCPKCEHPLDRHKGICHYLDSCEGRACGCTYKQEPVADGGGMPKPYVVTKGDEEQAKVVPSEIARPFVAKLVACERALASSQEALRESERQKNLAIVAASVIHERMQQAVDQMKPWLRTDCGCAVLEAIKLLSPEGSSR